MSFIDLYKQNQSCLQQIERVASDLHAAVNQHYDRDLPYAFHLRLTASYLTRFAHLLPVSADNIQTLYAAAFFHDSIEDARLTYNDLVRQFERLNQAGCNIQVHDAAEIVYALTNDKGRTRSERAGDAYYEGIRSTPFASVLKVCDRLANLRYSTLFGIRQRMVKVYREEMPHFVKAVTEGAVTLVPQEMIDELYRLMDEGFDLD